MSNYLRRVTETVQDITPQSDVTVVQQQSTTDPGKVVIGFQLSQATWDRAIGAASVFAVFGGAVYIQRWYKRWQKERRLQHKRNEMARAENAVTCQNILLFMVKSETSSLKQIMLSLLQ